MRGSVTGLHGPKTARSSCSRVRDPYFRGVYFEAHFVTNEIACTDEKPRAAYDPAGSETDRRLARTRLAISHPVLPRACAPRRPLARTYRGQLEPPVVVP
jgi:hypothetical protein